MKFSELNKDGRLGAVIRIPGLADVATVVAFKNEVRFGIAVTTYRLNWVQAGGQLSDESELTDFDVVKSGGLLFRPQRGTLSTALDEAGSFDDHDHLERYLEETFGDEYNGMEIKPYSGFDARIGWNTGVVIWRGAAVGFVHLRSGNMREEV